MSKQNAKFHKGLSKALSRPKEVKKIAVIPKSKPLVTSQLHSTNRLPLRATDKVLMRLRHAKQHQRGALKGMSGKSDPIPKAARVLTRLRKAGKKNLAKHYRYMMRLK